MIQRSLILRGAQTSGVASRLLFLKNKKFIFQFYFKFAPIPSAVSQFLHSLASLVDNHLRLPVLLAGH